MTGSMDVLRDTTPEVSSSISVTGHRLDALDRELYDTYVQGHPEGTPYHLSGWLLGVEEAYGHACQVFSVWRDSRLCGVLPLCMIRRPLLGTSVVSLPFCDLGGVLADDVTATVALYRAAGAHLKSIGAGTAEIRQLGMAMDRSEDSLVAESETAIKVSMRATLPENSDSLLKSFKAKLRSQIKKAEKNGLTATVSKDDSALSAFYPVFAANMHRLGSPVHSLDWFLRLKKAYGDNFLTGLVYLEDEPVGAGVVLIVGDRACIPWASTLAQYNRLAPNMLLYWSLLSHVCDHGVRSFDFGRSSLGEGTYRFKRQWGATPYALTWNRLTQAGELQTVPFVPASARAQKIRSLIEFAWQRLPLALANWLGPRIRKYITL